MLLLVALRKALNKSFNPKFLAKAFFKTFQQKLRTQALWKKLQVNSSNLFWTVFGTSFIKILLAERLLGVFNRNYLKATDMRFFGKFSVQAFLQKLR